MTMAVLVVSILSCVVSPASMLIIVMPVILAVMMTAAAAAAVEPAFVPGSEQ